MRICQGCIDSAAEIKEPGQLCPDSTSTTARIQLGEMSDLNPVATLPSGRSGPVLNYTVSNPICESHNHYITTGSRCQGIFVSNSRNLMQGGTMSDDYYWMDDDRLWEDGDELADGLPLAELDDLLAEGDEYRMDQDDRTDRHYTQRGF